MGTRRRLAPLLLAVGVAAYVVHRRRGTERGLLPAPSAPTPDVRVPQRLAAEPPADPHGLATRPPADPGPLAAELPADPHGLATRPPADPGPLAAELPAGPPSLAAQLPADPRPPRAARDLALGYVSIPAVDDRHREDLRRQVRHIRSACDALELSLVDLIPDTESDDVCAAERPGLRRLLRRLARGDASCLVTTTVERLASSAEDWGDLLTRLEEDGIRLVVVDDALDTGLEGGRAEAWALIGQEAPGTR